MKCLLVILLLAFVAPLRAQTYWRYPGAVAGATAGGVMMLGLNALSDMGCLFESRENCAPMDPGGRLALTGGFGLLGYLHGLNADRTLARGDMLSPGTYSRIRAQLVLTPILMPFVLFSGVRPDRTRQTLTLAGAAGGAVVGYALLRKYEPALWPRTRVGVRPSARGVSLQLSMGW